MEPRHHDRWPASNHSSSLPPCGPPSASHGQRTTFHDESSAATRSSAGSTFMPVATIASPRGEQPWLVPRDTIRRACCRGESDDELAVACGLAYLEHSTTIRHRASEVPSCILGLTRMAHCRHRVRDSVLVRSGARWRLRPSWGTNDAPCIAGHHLLAQALRGVGC